MAAARCSLTHVLAVPGTPSSSRARSVASVATAISTRRRWPTYFGVITVPSASVAAEQVRDDGPRRQPPARRARPVVDARRARRARAAYCVLGVRAQDVVGGGRGVAVRSRHAATLGARQLVEHRAARAGQVGQRAGHVRCHRVRSTRARALRRRSGEPVGGHAGHELTSTVRWRAAERPPSRKPGEHGGDRVGPAGLEQGRRARAGPARRRTSDRPTVGRAACAGDGRRSGRCSTSHVGERAAERRDRGARRAASVRWRASSADQRRLATAATAVARRRRAATRPRAPATSATTWCHRARPRRRAAAVGRRRRAAARRGGGTRQRAPARRATDGGRGDGGQHALGRASGPSASATTSASGPAAARAGRAGRCRAAPPVDQLVPVHVDAASVVVMRRAHERRCRRAGRCRAARSARNTVSGTRPVGGPLDGDGRPGVRPTRRAAPAAPASPMRGASSGSEPVSSVSTQPPARRRRGGPHQWPAPGRATARRPAPAPDLGARVGDGARTGAACTRRARRRRRCTGADEGPRRRRRGSGAGRRAIAVPTVSESSSDWR